MKIIFKKSTLIAILGIFFLAFAMVSVVHLRKNVDILLKVQLLLQIPVSCKSAKLSSGPESPVARRVVQYRTWLVFLCSELRGNKPGINPLEGE